MTDRISVTFTKTPYGDNYHEGINIDIGGIISVIEAKPEIAGPEASIFGLAVHALSGYGAPAGAIITTGLQPATPAQSQLPSVFEARDRKLTEE